MKRGLLTTLAVGALAGSAYLVTQSAPVPTLRVMITGSGAEWLTLPFATNWQLVALTSTDLVNWQASLPVVTNFGNGPGFEILSNSPVFCRAVWEHK